MDDGQENDEKRRGDPDLVVSAVDFEAQRRQVCPRPVISWNVVMTMTDNGVLRVLQQLEWSGLVGLNVAVEWRWWL